MTTPTTIQGFSYGSTNAKLIENNYTAGGVKIFASVGGTAMAEYTEYTATVPTWTKTYTYLGSRMLASIEPNGSGGEYIEFNHPDRLSTRLITNSSGSYEQTHLPFGTTLNAESTGSTQNRFTTYDRSTPTGLDYALNRTYDSKQGRFTQVDPIGMQATSLEAPQTLNLYNYCGNDPINRSDPGGLFWGAIGRFFKKLWKIISAVADIVAKVLNNRWVRLAFFVLDFILPGLGGLALKIAEFALKAYNTASDIVGMIQLSGMVIKGKFKELGISLIAAAAMAPLTAIMAGIKMGLQKAIFKPGGGFNRGSFFKNAWNGFKKGLKDGWDNFKDGFSRRGLEALIPFYGNFCAPSYGDLDPYQDPINGQDDACKKHDWELADIDDRAYEGNKSKSWILWRKLGADMKLIARTLGSSSSVHIIDIAFGGRTGLGASYKFMLVPGFLIGRDLPMGVSLGFNKLGGN